MGVKYVNCSRNCRNSLSPSRCQRAFTLVELMVTISIAAVLIAIALPNFRDVVANNRLIAQANEFVVSMHLAKSLAIKHQRRAQVCTTSDPFQAVPSCKSDASPTDWSSGWFSWVDLDRDSVIDNDEVMRVSQGIEGNTSFTSTDFASFTFNSLGVLTPSGRGDTLDLCDSRTGETGRRITILPTGRTSVGDLTCP